jgi:hypothetical protein
MQKKSAALTKQNAHFKFGAVYYYYYYYYIGPTAHYKP